VIAAVRTERAKMPDKPGAAPKPSKDSPFAALASLNAPPAARPRRRRPKKKAQTQKPPRAVS